MAEFIKGDVVVVSFPFSDMSQSKRRPALVVAKLKGDDLILCQITSRNIQDDDSVPIENEDFENGGLNKSSNIRPNRIFTAEKRILLYKAGQLKKEKITQTISKIIAILNE